MNVTDETNRLWMGLYLGTNIDYFDACVRRAYRDCNRTMHGLSKRITKHKYNQIHDYIKTEIDYLFQDAKFSDQKEFDNWHKKSCHQLIYKFFEVLGYKITIGQSQKWLNMSLKYLFAVGSKQIKNSNRFSQFYHVPIDNLIQIEFLKYGVPKLSIAWSKLNDYNRYFEYQTDVRNAFRGKVPFLEELKIFNTIR